MTSDCEPPIRNEFVAEVLNRAEDAWLVHGTVEEKWSAVRSVFTQSAEVLLGRERRHQPDWFQESISTLQPVLQERNNLHNKWIATNDTRYLSQFKQAKMKARQSIREAKNSWFKQKATEAQRERFGGNKVWMCIRDMQRARRGLVPAKIVIIEDENGDPCSTTLAQKQRWGGTLPRCLMWRASSAVMKLIK